MGLSVTLRNNNGPIVGPMTMERKLNSKKDLKIVCKDGTLEWNSLLMSTWSKVARTFFMEEKVSLNGEDMIMLLIPDLKKATMKHVLDWSVTGKVTLTNHNLVREVIWALQSLGSSAQLSVVPAGILSPARDPENIDLTSNTVGAVINTDRGNNETLNEEEEEENSNNVPNSSIVSSLPGSFDTVRKSCAEAFNTRESVEEYDCESDMADFTGNNNVCGNFSTTLSPSRVSVSPNGSVQKANSSTMFTGINAVECFNTSIDGELAQDDEHLEVDLGEELIGGNAIDFRGEPAEMFILPDLDENNPPSKTIRNGDDYGQLSPDQHHPNELPLTNCNNAIAQLSKSPKKGPNLQNSVNKKIHVVNTPKKDNSKGKIRCLLCNMSIFPMSYKQMSKHLCTTHYQKKILDQYGDGMICPICKKHMSKSSRNNTHNISHLGVSHGYIRSLVPQVIRDQLDQLRGKDQPKQDEWDRCKAHFVSVDQSMWSCCQSFLGSPHELRLHLARVHYADDLVAIYGSPDTPCQLCGSDRQHTATEKRGIVLHMASSHPSSIYALMTEEEGNLLKACFKTNNQLKVIKDHAQMKSREKKYIHKNGGLTVSSWGPKSSLTSDPQSSGFECPLCPFRHRKSKRSLRYHLAAKHYRDKIFSLADFSESNDCSVCRSLLSDGSIKKNVRSYNVIRHLGISHGYLDRIMSREVAKYVD